MVSDFQRQRIWEEMIHAQTFAYYFAELTRAYTLREQVLAGIVLVLSSSTFASVTVGLPWAFLNTAALPLLTVVVSIALIVAQQMKQASKTADLHWEWSRLATGYLDLWADLASPDVLARWERLEDQGRGFSKVATGLPNKQRKMRRWQKYVQNRWQARLATSTTAGR